MPELPEVETVRRGLQPVMEGRRILSADIRRPDLRWPFPKDMAARLTGARVDRLERRSKYILAALDSGETLILHLGMSGRILIGTSDSAARGTAPGSFALPAPVPGVHDHVLIDLEGGARITFNDARRFGAMDLVDTAGRDAHPWLRALGPEPLGNGFHADYLRARLAGRSAPVKASLLDQRIVAGLGNIYVCESLFRAGISPRRASGRIGAARIEALVRAIREVLVEAIEAGGSSLRDYRQTSGELGYFQHAFRVYGREGMSCSTDGCGGVIHRLVQSGRSSFHCPRCQR